jgi:outer membrane protein assembly factor BamB
MRSYPSLRRWFVGGLTGTVFATVIFIASCNRGPTPAPAPKPAPVAVMEKGGVPAETPKAAAKEVAKVDVKEPAPKESPKSVVSTSGKDGWRMYGGSVSRNMANSDAKGLPISWDVEEKKNILWIADLGSKAYGGPVVADGKVLIGTNNQKPRDKKWIKDGRPIDLGVLMCFDQGKGEFLWQIAFPKLAAGLVNDWPLEGLCSTPTVEGDKAYFVSNRCEVVCVNIKDGSFDWKLDMIKNLGVFPHNLADCSPLLVGNDLWVVTSNGVDEGHINVPAPKAPSFIKVDKNKGKVLWQDNTPTIRVTQVAKEGDEKEFFKRLVNRGELIQHGQWSSPSHAVVNGQPQFIFPGGNGWIYSYDEDGKLLWKFDCNPKDAKYELAGNGTRSDFIATPVVYKNRVYIGVGQDPEHETGVGHLWCIDMSKKGDVSPELVEDYGVWPPKTKRNPNSALVWHYGGPIKGKDAKKSDRNYYFGRTMSTCAIHDDLCYVADLNGWVYCIDANTGELYWSHDTDGMTWSSPYYADGKVYMGNDADKVVVFAHGKQKKVLAENEMAGHVRAAPVAVGNVLYVMTENKLYAIGNKQ